MNTKSWAAALAVLTLGTGAQAAGFVNGGFEDGNTNAWSVGTGSRTSTNNTNLNPSSFLNGNTGRSAVITAGYVDPNVGALLGGAVYSGAFAYRVEDTTSGGFASVISQSVTNYTDANIFFAWKAVLEGAHDATTSATMIITLRDDTTGQVVITRNNNAADTGAGVPAAFQSANGYFYTPQWQIEQLAIDASLSGHNFTLTVLAADCQPSGHAGYVYLDGFGAVIPTDEVPEPGSIALVGAALLGLAAARRRKQA